MHDHAEEIVRRPSVAAAGVAIVAHKGDAGKGDDEAWHENAYSGDGRLHRHDRAAHRKLVYRRWGERCGRGGKTCHCVRGCH